MLAYRFFQQHKSKGWKIGAILLLLLCLYLSYDLLLAPTRIALVNFPSYQVSNIALSTNSRLIHVEEVSVEKAATLDSYDAILVFGPGLRLNEEQIRHIEKAGSKGKTVYTFVFSSGLIANQHIDSLQQKQLDDYYANRSKTNYRNMLHYIHNTFDRHKLLKATVEQPEIIPTNMFFYLEDGLFFHTADELTAHLRQHNYYQEGAPRIAFLTGMTSPLEGNRGYIDSLIVRLSDVGFNVYPISASGKRQELLESVHPDAVVYLPMGRLGGDQTVKWLTENNIPLFCPLSIMQSRTEWMDDTNTNTVTGGYLAARIVLPEIDGGIDPLVISTQNRHENGYVVFDGETERLENFANNVKNYMQLRQIPNRDKRIAICYFKGAGQNALVAANLEVAPSLYELLKRLKEEGYQVTGLPDSFEAFNRMLQQQAPIMGSYAKGAQADFLKSDYPLWISREEYEQWATEVLHPDKYREVVEKYGNAPGEYMSRQQEGEEAIAIACLRFGNIVLFPQPHPAVGDNEFQLIHGANVAPPHAYLAPYLWVQKGFQADALLHFGTHGSLEFTPGKPVGLSQKDWPDCLIGTVPHFYYYTIGNVGEGIIAKRRTHATLVSYLTPPFMESRTRRQFTELMTNIERWHTATEAQQLVLVDTIKEQAFRLGLQRDLQLDTITHRALSETEIERIENYAEEIANEKMTGKLYTLGIPFSPQEAEETLIAMTADPIAYSLARLDLLAHKIDKEQMESTVFISRHYLTPVKEKLHNVLQQPGSNPEQLLQSIASISREDLARARAIEMAANPRQMSMSDMMAAAEGSEMTSESNEQATKMPAGMPKSGKMPDWVKKRIEARKKARQEGKKDILPDIPTEEKEYAQAVLEVERSLKNVSTYKALLAHSPEQELQALMHAFNGGYIAPTPGGDVILSPNTLPTGRNLYAINAETTPSTRAWDNGKQLVQTLLQQYHDQHGSYPRKVNYTFWAGEFIETEGATLAQALYMLGVEPVRDGMGRVTDLRLIPSQELGRPRIDIVVQTSGQLRDLAASRLAMITKAVNMASRSDGDEYGNYVAEGTTETEKQLVDKGLSPQEARKLSTARVFGGVNGHYGTGIMDLVEKGDAWDEESQVATTYLNNMSAIYGDSEQWGQVVKGLLEVALQHTDVVVQPRQSNTWGALSLDHVYEFMGGSNLAVRHVTGKDPDAFFADYRNRNHVRMQNLKEAIGVESRTTLLNPAYIREKMKGGASSAGTFAKTIRNTYGWNVMRPGAIDQALWNELYNMYVRDEQHLGLHQFFKKENPAALQEITAVMLETIRKGYWDASDSQIRELAELHVELIEEFAPACSGFVCDNVKLEEFIAQHTDEPASRSYRQNIKQIKEPTTGNGEARVLKEEQSLTNLQQQESPVSNLLVIPLVLLLFGALVWIIRRRR